MATATPTKRAVQTPGEDPQATTDTVDQAETGGEATQETKAEPTVADLMKIIEHQAAQMAGLNAAMQNLSRAQTPASRVTEELPDIDSLDKTGIKTPVLTKTGWYVPETFGTNPAQVR